MDEPVRQDSAFQIVLRLNLTGLGSWFQDSGAEDHLLGLGLALTVFGTLATVVVVRRRPWRFSRKLLACVLVSLVMSWFAPSVANVLTSLAPALAEPRANLLLLRGSQAAVWTTLWAITPASHWQYFFALVAGAAFGNFASLLVPPFHVVDFLYSSFVHELIGFGVFNLADLAYLVGLAVPVAAAAAWVIRRAFFTTRA
jgi:hypothetical protein